MISAFFTSNPFVCVGVRRLNTFGQTFNVAGHMFINTAMPTDICICVCTYMKLNFFAQTICISIQFSLYQLCVYACVRVWFFCFVYTLLLHNGVATKFACCCHIHTPVQSHVSMYLRADVDVELHSRNYGGTHTRTHKQRDSQRHI